MREINLNDLSLDEFVRVHNILSEQDKEFKICILLNDQNEKDSISFENYFTLDHDTVADLVLFWHQVYEDYYCQPE